MSGPLVEVRDHLPKLAAPALEDHVIWLISSDVFRWFAAMDSPTDRIECSEPDGATEDLVVPFGWGLDAFQIGVAEGRVEERSTEIGGR
jgi:hypothetical protein